MLHNRTSLSSNGSDPLLRQVELSAKASIPPQPPRPLKCGVMVGGKGQACCEVSFTTSCAWLRYPHSQASAPSHTSI